MPTISKRAQHFAEVQRRHDDGETLVEIGADLGISPVTIGRWYREAGIKVIQRGRRKDPSKWVTRVCEYEPCSKEFSIQQSQKRRFCSRECTNNWQRENAIKKVCPCGKVIEKEPGATYVYTYRKYCSDECRKEYGGKRQKDPTNYVTIICQTCGKKVERYKGYGNGALMFCSNECAQKHTKTKVHYAFRDSDVVLDSTWEGLFYCLMRYRKIKIERVDRVALVEWSKGHWYAPDFKVNGHHVEVKGVIEHEDLVKWGVWRAQRGPLLVITKVEMETLLKANRAKAISLLDHWVKVAIG